MLEIITIAVLLLLDQVSKYLTDLYLSPLGTTLPGWDGVFQLTSAHNTGAAWGMLKGFRWFFIVLTVAVLAALIIVMIRNRKKLFWFPRLILAMIVAGAAGNLIDRLLFGYVRDMFYFVLIDFPIFNVADSALSVGCVLLAVNILFMKKERSVLVIEDKPDGGKADGDAG